LRDGHRFFRGEVDKYTWQDLGSSLLPGDATAAFLWAQLEEAQGITARRIALWRSYHEMLAPLEHEGLLRRPIVPTDCHHDGHIYYVLLAPEIDRGRVLGELKAAGVHAVFHYVPLHSSPAGRRFGRTQGDLAITDPLAARLIRLPMWIGLSEAQQQRVCDALEVTADGQRPAQSKKIGRTF